MALNSFAPTNFSSFTALGISTLVALPGGGGAALLVTNCGPSAIAVKLGDNTVTVAGSQNGVVINAGQSLALTVGTATYLAAISLGFGNAQVNLAQGT
jgi:hypothetical protein